MARPSLGAGLARVHVYGRTGLTDRGTLKGTDLTWTRGKSIDSSSIQFTANAKESTLAASPAMLEDALAIVELDVGGVWTPIGTPYVLSPGQGTVYGTAEGSALEHAPTGVGAALGLTQEWLVLHSGGRVNRRGPTDRYIGWQTSSFNDTSWTNSPIVTTSSLAIFDAKYHEPAGWPSVASGANWLKGDGTGPIILYRCGSFTVTTARKYIIGFSADEEAKVYLDGPGWGGVIIETSDQETGYMTKNVWAEVLQPGTYFLSAEMTTVNSAGGDGFDGIRFYVATVNQKGRAETVVLMSDVACKVKNITSSQVRPGFTPDQVVELMRTENVTWGVASASLLSVAATDTMPTGKEWVWPVGTPVSQVLSDLEIEVAFHVSTSWVLQVTASPGSDLSATIALTPGAMPETTGMNLEGLGWTSDPVLGTRAVVLTNDGYVEAINSTIEATTPARGMYLESGTSGSIAQGKAFALDAIAQSGVVRRAYTADAAAVTGKVPEVNYKVNDRIMGRTYQKAAAAMVVTKITGTNQATYAAFTLELTEP